ncbi:hypothetical protein ACUNGV_25835 [Serratia sp. IR-2025]
MDKIRDESRMQFEEWVSLIYSGGNLLLRFGPNKESYHQTIINGLWIAWQAARESIVLELPSEDDFVMDEAIDCLNECKSAIRSIGLSIKGE